MKYTFMHSFELVDAQNIFLETKSKFWLRTKFGLEGVYVIDGSKEMQHDTNTFDN